MFEREYNIITSINNSPSAKAYGVETIKFGSRGEIKIPSKMKPESLLWKMRIKPTNRAVKITGKIILKIIHAGVPNILANVIVSAYIPV